MNGFFVVGVIGVLIAVASVLGLGVLNMARGGTPARSQTLMRWRVGLQALALVLVVVGLWFGR